MVAEASHLRFLVFEDTRCLCDGPASLAAEFIEQRDDRFLIRDRDVCTEDVWCSQ